MSDADGEGGPPRAYGLRKRRRAAAQDTSQLDSLLELAERAARIVVFSGSGLSAASGMSTFSTRGGLYERAQKRFRLADGKALFTYAFFDRQRPEAQAFFADIYSEAVGMDTWHHERNPGGVTVEMHGNVRHLVCAECHATLPLDAGLAGRLRALQQVPCPAPGCGNPALRFKIMMYDDAEGECITPDDCMDLMEADVQAADLILWVGISFQQSASTQYFKKVRHWLQHVGRLGDVAQAIINPSDDAYFYLISACCNQADLAEARMGAARRGSAARAPAPPRRGAGSTCRQWPIHSAAQAGRVVGLLPAQNVIQVLDTADEVLPRVAARAAGSIWEALRPPPALLAGVARAGGAAAAARAGEMGGDVAGACTPASAAAPAAVQQQQQQQQTDDDSTPSPAAAPWPGLQQLREPPQQQQHPTQELPHLPPPPRQQEHQAQQEQQGWGLAPPPPPQPQLLPQPNQHQAEGLPQPQQHLQHPQLEIAEPLLCSKPAPLAQTPAVAAATPCPEPAAPAGVGKQGTAPVESPLQVEQPSGTASSPNEPLQQPAPCDSPSVASENVLAVGAAAAACGPHEVDTGP
eukprot:scaffold2.g7258.t1